MSKIIQKYSFTVEDKYGNKVSVFGRIEKEGNLYYWYVSHRTKPQDSEAIGLYLPSNTESSFEDAEHWLNSYIDMMRDSKVIVLNENI